MSGTRQYWSVPISSGYSLVQIWNFAPNTRNCARYLYLASVAAAVTIGQQIRHQLLSNMALALWRPILFDDTFGADTGVAGLGEPGIGGTG